MTPTLEYKGHGRNGHAFLVTSGSKFNIISVRSWTDDNFAIRHMSKNRKSMDIIVTTDPDRHSKIYQHGLDAIASLTDEQRAMDVL